MTAEAAPRVEMLDWHALTVAERDAVHGLEISAQQIEFAGSVGKT